ncbi:WD40-repeat-containing domain protein [Bisporella sp. PMI_857]|nr:WD40-repeat-containing domain protein [Bisporella sp. PMI_857]
MRLLQHSGTNEFSFTEDLVGDDRIPPYAILSHTWGSNTDEVAFEDLKNGTGKRKAGYEKIRFCGEQARQDGLQYFWIDTCCINKANYTELSQAINSMFRWYQSAAKCYVYLSDVSTIERKASDRSPEFTWESAFQESRWFKRGWTLQELLAPATVEFFSREHQQLGDKRSLRQRIHDITGIANSALQGAHLSHFSVDERLSWIDRRQTKLEEDKAYSLLGIFDVSMPLIYGEGGDKAFKRLREEVDKHSKGLLQQLASVQLEKEDLECIQHLRLTDPRDDKKRIEETKGGLLGGSYQWILENSYFQQWYNDEQSHLLWISGDPGKGKTMLLCGIINELENLTAGARLSFFFCQATDSRINSATAVLRGLIYLLIKQQPSLISHLQERYRDAGKQLFEDVNAWSALSRILTDILEDANLNSVYFIIDALDECTTDSEKLLELIVQKSASLRTKWIVSSRNWPDIEERLEMAEHKVRLCLELNTESVSTAVDTYIQHKVLQLAQRKKYDDKMRDTVLDYLSLNAHNTFLWVALVCQHLEKIPRWNTLAKLDAFPPGLNSLYELMVEQICNSDNADLCKRILASIAIVYRPITLKELTSLVEMLENMFDDLKSLKEIIGLCGSFLTIREDIIYFVHQSMKDYLFEEACDKIFASGKEEAHYMIFSRSLKVMSRTLRRDIYSLRALGYPIGRVKPPDPDPLAATRYSCIYWVNHLYSWNSNSYTNHIADLQNGGMVDMFIRKKYLYWLEALSLCRSMSEGVLSMGRADALQLIELVQDAHRFIKYHKWVIENSPLQVYASALLFSPAYSLTRALFEEEEPKWITIKPAMGDKWSACLQTLEGHSSWVKSVAYSHDSTRLASASSDNTSRIWDANSGECLQTLEGHSGSVNSVAFSHDSTRLASASDDKTIKTWDASNGKCLQTLEGHGNFVQSAVFSHDSTRLASASADETIKIWDASSGKCLQTLEGHTDLVWSVVFSYDSTRLASASDDNTVKIWDLDSGEHLRTFKGHSRLVRSVVFLHNSTRFVLASNYKTINIWDADSGECLQTFEGHSRLVWSVAFSHNSTRLASASSDNAIRIWDANSGKCLQTLEGHGGSVRSVAFSHDSTRLASASADRMVKIWDVCGEECLQTLESHSGSVRSVAFLHNSTRLVSSSNDHTVKIWDVASRECLQTLEGHSGEVTSVAYSHDSRQLAASGDERVKIWDVCSGECLQTLEGHFSFVCSVAFSHDSTRLASASEDKTIKIWDASSGKCLQTLEGHSGSVWSVIFSHDSTRLASASDDKTIKTWDASNGKCLQTLEGHGNFVQSAVFSHDSTRLASASSDNTIKIWDASNGKCLQTLEGHSDYVQSAVFSHDLTRVASASDDKTIKIWDANIGKCLQTLDIGEMLINISFDTTSSYLNTEIGTIAIDASSTSNLRLTGWDSYNPRYKGVALSSDRAWVTYNSENLVWLPSEYRPSCSAVSEKTIGIGAGSGKVWICTLKLDNSKILNI